MGHDVPPCSRLKLEDDSVTEMGREPDIIAAHKLCSNHREAISAAERCGCFYCCSEFVPDEISDWVGTDSDDLQAGNTALCPKCGIDSVIPMNAGMDQRFLRRMQEHWF